MSDNIELTDLNHARGTYGLNIDTTTHIDTGTITDGYSKGVISKLSNSVLTLIHLITSSFFELFLPMTYLKVPNGAPARDHVS